MSDIFASTQTFSLKQAGLLVALAMGSVLLNGCDCDGDCNAPIVSGAVATSPSTPATPTPPVTPTPAPTPAPAARCADPRFCKVSSTGEILDDSATSWSCVRETVNGTVNYWEVKDPTPGSLRNKDWTYAKAGSAGACGGTVAGCSVDAYVAAVNAGTRPCGPTRTCVVPTHAELIYLALPTAAFPQPDGNAKLTTETRSYAPPPAFFPDAVTSGFYFNSSEGRQVNYSAVIPAGRPFNNVSDEGMAPAAADTLAGHLRLICK